MKLRVDGNNIFDKPIAHYEELRRESDIALRSRALLKSITKTIQDAGGAFEEDTLAEMTVAEFVVLAVRNSISIHVGYAKTPTPYDSFPPPPDPLRYVYSSPPSTDDEDVPF